MNKPYKDGNFWRGESQDWEIARYGEAEDGKGDLILNTLSKIIDDEDASDFTVKAIHECYLLLKAGKRWPDRMNQEMDAKHWLHWKWSKLLYKLKLIKHVKYRPQKGMTRDPFILFYAVQMFYYGVIKFRVKLPIWLFTPTYVIWRWGLEHSHKKAYVERLRYYKHLANVMNYEAQIGK